MYITKQAEQEIYLIAQHPPLTLLGSHRPAVMHADTSARTGEHTLTSPPPPSTTLAVGAAEDFQISNWAAAFLSLGTAGLHNSI